jgi:hypothetical protein
MTTTEGMKMEWISVKDGLPPINTWCVVLDNEYNPPIRDIALFLDYPGGYYFCIGKDVKQTWPPTHWIPLPNPPEGA